jgi:hypothetical protein
MLIVSASILFVLLLLFSTILLYVILKKKMQYWIVSDIKRGIVRRFSRKPKEPIHIIFCFVDHFEPGNGCADIEEQTRRVDAWVERYPELASRHQDSDGICPQRTFFFPPHYDTHDHLKKIVDLCSRGYGEVEMHLHHDRMEPWPDDELSLEKKILDCIQAYSRYGVFCLPSGRKTYGFIHGDWALANSLKGNKHCGVNHELAILKRTGCYADFTFPVCNEAQPKLANTIFYAQTDCVCPKSYNNGSMLVVKKRKGSENCLMLIQGIIGLRWKSRTHLFKPSIEQSNISGSDLPFPARSDYWVNKAVHVSGKPNWLFIKVHGHGAGASVRNREVLLGKEMDSMYTYFESAYRDSLKYCLHYVSAREQYNIIKAAEDGQEGNPNAYRDYSIPRYVYLPKRLQ